MKSKETPAFLPNSLRQLQAVFQVSLPIMPFFIFSDAGSCLPLGHHMEETLQYYSTLILHPSHLYLGCEHYEHAN